MLPWYSLNTAEVGDKHQLICIVSLTNSMPWYSLNTAEVGDKHQVFKIKIIISCIEHNS
jgi:putative Ca2+/H+ antiporter (TMEM165/GDT1 family)